MAGTVIDELIVRLGLDATDYQKGSDTATQANKKLRDDAETTATELEAKGKTAASFWTVQKVELLGFLAVVAGGVETLKAFIDLTARTATAGGEKGFFAQANNADPARLSGLESLAEQYGSTAAAADSATTSIAAMQRQSMIDPMGAANSPIYQGLMRLGINIGDKNHPRDAGAILEDLDVKLRGMPRDQAMAWGAQIGLDSGYTNSVLAAPGAPDNFASLVKRWQTITDAETGADKQYVTAVGQFDSAVTKFDNDLTQNLIPPLTSLVQVLTELVQWFDSSNAPSAPPAGYIRQGDRLIWVGGDTDAGSAGGHYIQQGARRIWVPNTGGAEQGISTEQWAAQLTQESGENQLNANGTPLISKKGAVGIAQLLPGTAQMVAKEHNIQWDENKFLHDAEYNSTLGRDYMNDLLSQFNDNYQEALAAYNAGPGAVQNSINQNGNNWLSGLPTETQRYVAGISGDQLSMHIAAAHAQVTAHSIPASVEQLVNGFRAARAQHKTNVTANINVNGAKSPAATAKAVRTSLSALAFQSMTGLA